MRACGAGVRIVSDPDQDLRDAIHHVSSLALAVQVQLHYFRKKLAEGSELSGSLTLPDMQRARDIVGEVFCRDRIYSLLLEEFPHWSVHRLAEVMGQLGSIGENYAKERLKR